MTNVVVACLLTPETKERLSSILSSAPISIDLDRVYVNLYEGELDTTNFTAEGPYSGKFTFLKILYSEEHEASQLVAGIDSQSLIARAQQFGTEVGTEFEEQLRCVFLEHAPPLSATNKGFISSVSDTFATKEERPFTFTKDLFIEV